MPKTDAPATRRSARIASTSSGPASKAAESKTPAVASKPKTASKAAASASKAAASASKASTKSADKAAKSGTKSATKSKDAAAATEAKTNGDDEAAPATATATAAVAEVAKPASATRGELKLGQGLPKITLQNEQGDDVDVSTLAGDRGVVIFLYPRADTPGCTNQACGYRDIYDDIAAFGYDIYGLSKDKPAAQLKWKNKRELNYSLLCDPESKLIKRLGAFVMPNNTKRSHFIFEKGTGKLVDIALAVKPADDPSNVLKFLKAHHK